MTGQVIYSNMLQTNKHEEVKDNQIQGVLQSRSNQLVPIKYDS